LERELDIAKPNWRSLKKVAIGLGILDVCLGRQNYTIEADVLKSRGCNSGYKIGDKFIMDVDGNFISKLCPKRLCVYLVSQLSIPVALINERLSEGLEPDHFHFMHYVRCPDVGVDCSGYGEVMLRVQVVPRQPQ
jgi:uncharacterized repeat protein (TIGR04076 family)